jgi:hypothetical protein
MILIRTNSVPGETRKVARRNATIVRNIPIIFCDALKIHQIKTRARVLRLKVIRRQNPNPNPF